MRVETTRVVSAAVARAVIVDARIEVAALVGATSAVEQLAMPCVDAGDDEAAKACLRVADELQQGAHVAQAMLDELMAQLNPPQLH